MISITLEKNDNQPANRREDLIEATSISSIDSATGKGVNICATLRKGDQTTGHPSNKIPRSSEKQRDMKYLISRLEVLHEQYLQGHQDDEENHVEDRIHAMYLEELLRIKQT